MSAPSAPKASARPHGPDNGVIDDATGVARNAAGRQVCGRQKSRGRGRCTSPFVGANGCCNSHGKNSLKGIASPTYKTGDRSKYLPAGIRDHFNARRRDPDLLVLMDELALLEAREWELLGKLDDGGAAASRWSDMASAWAKFSAAWAMKDFAAVQTARTSIEALVAAGSADGKLWEDIKSVIDLRRKVADTETKRLVRKHRVLTEDRAYELLRMVLHTIRARVTDRKVLGLIAGDLERVLGPAGGVALSQVPA